MGLGLGLGIWWSTQTSIIPSLLKLLEARADYFENKICTTATLEEIAAVRYTAPVLPIGLLADYPGASAAYSLRNLIDTTTSVVRVRRLSDNTEQDFTATEITDGTLATFCSGTDGFVTVWYDQSGNSKNATQSTATRQPKLVLNGVINLKGGKPAIFNNNSALVALNFSEIRAKTVIMSLGILSNSGQSNLGMILGGVRDLDGNTDYSIRCRYYNPAYYWLSTDPAHWFIGNNGDYYINGNLAIADNISNEITDHQLNFATNNNPIGVFNQVYSNGKFNRTFQGIFQEIIIYPSDQSANRTGIETDINTEYNIY